MEERPAMAAPISAPKQSKLKFSQAPPWLRSVIIMFGVYSLVVIIHQYTQLPSGSVEKLQPAQTANVTDPSAIDKIAQLEKDVASNPENAEGTLELANALHDAKFYPKAIETYKKYLQLVPRNFDARVDLGICYYEVGNNDQAIKEIESVMKVQPKHQMAAFNLGIIQLSNQNMVEAKKWLNKCIEIDPQSTAGLRAQQILQQH